MGKKKESIKNGINILSIEGIDLLAGKPIYTKLKNGKVNGYAYKNVLDYSLDLKKLCKIDKEFYFKEKYNNKIKLYSNKVINVTFEHAETKIYKTKKEKIYKLKKVKNYNFINKNIVCGKKVKSLVRYITIKCKTKKVREQLYNNGFDLYGIHYVRWKRSSGSARVGKCLFIDEKLFNIIHKWEMANLNIKDNDDINDLASFEAYVSLTTSSIIDTIKINPNNILILDDTKENTKSRFTEKVFATEEVNGKLITTKKVVDIENKIWDGQSLLDSSMYTGEYKDKCMLLLRNKFFKSACFKTNIQQWFKDNNITDVKQLNGYTRAKDINDIKLITTYSSVKYIKFNTLSEWLNCLERSNIFGIVKYDKPTDFFNGRMVQTHYQLLNSLQITKDEMKRLLKDSIEYMKLLKVDIAVVKNYLNCIDNIDDNNDLLELKNRNDVIYNLIKKNKKFKDTQLYRDFINAVIKSYRKNIKCGHILVKGNYSTLLSCPIEMLQHSIGEFSGRNILENNTIHSLNFEYDNELVCTRSPHIASGNVLVTKNVANELIDKYICLTPEVVVINSINENILQRLQGADMDSDAIAIIDNQIILNSAKRNYNKFLVPCNLVEPSGKLKWKYNNIDKANLDYKTANNKIGEIVNLSQNLNSILFDKYYETNIIDENIYTDIAQLSSMSGIAIDSAKKDYTNISLAKELQIIRDKYSEELKNNKSYFFKAIDKTKKFNNNKKKKVEKEVQDEKKKIYKKYHTSMDYLLEIMEDVKGTKFTGEKFDFIEIFDIKNLREEYTQIELVKEFIDDIKQYKSSLIDCDKEADKKQRHRIRELCKEKIIDFFNDKNINKSTIIYLLKEIEKQENGKIKNYMFTILFSLNHDFIKKLINNEYADANIKTDDNEYLQEVHNVEDSDINIFGIYYKRVS